MHAHMERVCVFNLPNPMCVCRQKNIIGKCVFYVCVCVFWQLVRFWRSARVYVPRSTAELASANYHVQNNVDELNETGRTCVPCENKKYTAVGVE